MNEGSEGVNAGDGGRNEGSVDVRVESGSAEAVRVESGRGAGGTAAAGIDRALLLDFYGELLTDRQREVWELHWNEDYSLAEVAAEVGLTRQGVRDLLRRAEGNLRQVEERTGLIRRELDRRARLLELQTLLEDLLPPGGGRGEALRRLRELL